MSVHIDDLAQEIIDGRRLSRHDDVHFFETCDLAALCQGADLIREQLCGNKVSLCAIINGKSGHCSENCKFCAQSSFNPTACQSYTFLAEEAIFKEAELNEKEGVHRFSIVTSGKALTGREFEQAVHVYKRINGELSIGLCASMGFLSQDQFKQLKAAGVTRYHHNIETSRRYFPFICTTHTYEMKINTIKMAQAEGFEICSGGIIGMGETFADRLDMALSLSELGIDSIPINVLLPIEGTPLESLPNLTEDEILRTIAMFRFINPTSSICFGAGRKLLASNGEQAFKSGANATITGNMLTTTGSTIQADKKMLYTLFSH